MPYRVCLKASRREQLIRAPVTTGAFQTGVKIAYRFPSAIQTPPEGKNVKHPFKVMTLKHALNEKLNTTLIIKTELRNTCHNRPAFVDQPPTTDS
ncbi:hypothetical protein J6590_020444 [Homalodisca vitripennis]|nr:hypothetical protein J6590_020444 [Homalodisca vitripennis]